MGWFSRMLEVIEWTDDTSNTIVHKVDLKKNEINKGSVLNVRDSQVAIFADKGKMADVFLPGSYKLDTSSLPIITKLLSWKYGFEKPFKSDVYFVNTKQFTNAKWGTTNPIMVRDADYGAVRVRGYGTYSYRVSDAFVFMKELSGTHSSFKTEDINEYLRSIVVTNISDAIGECKIPILDMAGNLVELGELVQKNLNKTMLNLGIEITKFNFENFSMPEELEKALDENTKLGMMRRNLDVYTTMAQADALKEAAKNPGMAGATMGAGLGMGMGVGLGNMFNNNQASQKSAPQEEKVACAKCGYMMKSSAKFCPECGAPAGNVCPKCGKPVKKGAKFCPECGAKLTLSCPKCGKPVKAGAKFCPECGEKL